MRRSHVIRATVLAAAVALGVGFVPTSTAGAGVTGPVGYTVEYTNIDGIVCRLAQVDLGTGVVTPIGDWLDGSSVYACSFDLAFAPGGTLYGIAVLSVEKSDVGTAEEHGAHLVRYDTGTGAVTDLGMISADQLELFTVHGITFDAAGRLFVYAEITGDDVDDKVAVPCDVKRSCLFQVDPANPGAAVQIGAGPANAGVQGLAARCAGDMFTGEGGTVIPTEASVDIVANAVQLDTVEPSTGGATAVGAAFGESVVMQTLAFDADGVLWGLGTSGSDAKEVGAQVVGEAQAFVIDPDTGSAVGGATLAIADEVNETRVFALAIAPLSCATPEPDPEPAPAAVVLEPNFTG